MSQRTDLNSLFCGVEPHGRHGFVYIVVFAGDIAKIGRSKDPSTRVSQHVSASCVPVEDGWLFSVVDSIAAERALLDWYADYQLNGGEWFVIPSDILREDLYHGPSVMINGVKFSHHCSKTGKEYCGACNELNEIERLELIGIS